MNKKLEYILNMYPNAKCELEYTSLFTLLIAIVLSAQTTDKKVNETTKILFAKYQTIQSLADANLEDVKSILKHLGMYQVKSKNIVEIAKIVHYTFNDNVPCNREILSTFPGVGNKTTNVLLAEGFKIPSFPVDTHVNRVSKRLGFARKKDSVEIVEQKMKKEIPEDKWIQMHHSIIFFGRYFCKAIHPECDKCALKDSCNKDNY